MNYDIDEFCVCPYDRTKMIAIGEETGYNWESVYIYECPKCHRIHRTTIRYVKSYDMKPKPDDREKVSFT